MSAPRATPHAVQPKIVRLALPLLPAPQRKAAAGSTSALTGGGGVVVPVVLTAEQSTDPFDLVAVTWRAGTAPKGTIVQTRVKENGTWTAWQVLALLDGSPERGGAEAEQAANTAREGTEPLTTERARGVQVRVLSPDGVAPQGLRTELIDGGTSAADKISEPAASAGAAVTTPSVISRRQWGCDESLTHGTPGYNPSVKALVLHNTAGSNSYSTTGAFAQIRADYAYHTVTLGWNDLGYNIVVDRFGRIYEGRRGSLTRAVVGAHAGGFNSYTFGFSIMGNFQVARPPAAAIAGIEWAMAWKAQEFGINPTTTTSLTSSGGGTSKYAAGTIVTKPTIIGHRDVGNTDCPGQYLYAYLPAIRSYIAGHAAWQPASGVGVTSAAQDYGARAGVSLVARLRMTHTWTMTVSSYCGTTVRTLSGTAAAGAMNAAWDLKNAGHAYVPPGLYTLAAGLRSASGVTTTYRTDVEVLTTPGAPAPACTTARFAGRDAFTTSVIVGRAAWPAATKAVLVLASDQVDGVVAAPLAVTMQAPLLLTATSALPAVVSADLRARHVTQVWIIGGTNMVGPAVEAGLRSLGVRTITRLSGATRYGTAAAVATAMGAPGKVGVVVSGLNPNLIDAVSVAGVAGRLHRPILLVTPTTVPIETQRLIKALGVNTVSIIGSTAAVSDGVSAALAGLGVAHRWRQAGVTAYDTAAVTAGAFGKLTGTTQVTVAAGNYPTIIDGFLGGQFGRPTVLTATTGLPATTSNWLKAANPTSVALVGGPNIIGTPVMRAVATAAAS